MRRILVDLGVTLPWLRPPLPLMEGTEVIEAQPDQASLTGRYVERAVRFLRRSRAEDRPFFLYLAHLYVHLPIYVQERFLDESENGPYGGAVAAIDWATDVILHELAALGLDERTIVIFTSDNGALDPRRGGSGSNLPLRGHKGTTWEGGQRVPCLVRWPGRIEPASVVTDWAASIDLFPTLAHLCGASMPDDGRLVDGVRIGGLLGLDDARPDPDRPFVYIQDGTLEAVRVGRWKLHVRKRQREAVELYDLQADVGEATDVADAHPDVVARLSAVLDEVRRDLGDEATGVHGAGVRPIGRVAEARTVTTFDPGHPYYQAEYDLPHRG
jgi:arylsulfatase A-like enzyme